MNDRIVEIKVLGGSIIRTRNHETARVILAMLDMDGAAYEVKVVPVIVPKYRHDGLYRAYREFQA